MMIKYSNGKEYKPTIEKKKTMKIKSRSSANRGMNLEDDINKSNKYYLEKNICLIYKRPTPINIVKVDYSRGSKITDAYFEKQSTTDYNGVYKGRYIDFEAKNTKNNSSFPLHNIYKHQIEHLRNVILHQGIAFFIIEFELKDEVYLLDAKFIIDFIEKNERKSIPYSEIKENGILIERGYNPRLDYISAIDKFYFNC
ncbi:MAG: Holliday junction resolvase RecU [Bacilli bacterium]